MICMIGLDDDKKNTTTFLGLVALVNFVLWMFRFAGMLSWYEMLERNAKQK